MKKTSKNIPLLSLLVSLYPEKSRAELHALILCGEVLVQGEKIRDPKAFVPNDAPVDFRSKKYVSRGGDKLEGVIHLWNLPVAGQVFLDAGASTGGFTDCLLKHGAIFVHSVDVGKGQLDFSLRQDPRVNNLEGVNLMGLEALDPVPLAAVCDLSFRSLRRAARKALDLTSGGWMAALLKPQFELTSESLEFDGIVEGKKIEGIVRSTLKDLESEGVFAHRLEPSPIKGRKGNQEVLVLLSLKAADDKAPLESDLQRLFNSL